MKFSWGASHLLSGKSRDITCNPTNSQQVVLMVRTVLVEKVEMDGFYTLQSGFEIIVGSISKLSPCTLLKFYSLTVIRGFPARTR